MVLRLRPAPSSLTSRPRCRFGASSAELQNLARAANEEPSQGSESSERSINAVSGVPQRRCYGGQGSIPLQVPSTDSVELQLSYHPTQSSCLLSGSTDGLVNIYNTAILDEDEGLVQVFNHGASISHAGFLPESALYALSHDETLSIYDLANPEDDSSKDNPQNPIKFGDLRPQLGCEYVVDILPTNGGAIVGAGSHR